MRDRLQSIPQLFIFNIGPNHRTIIFILYIIDKNFFEKLKIFYLTISSIYDIIYM